jgi:molybdopterin-guanine dinucleotide biosynthesis protein A
MGVDKASLPFGAETMLERVVRRLGEVVEPIIVVGAVDQNLPALPSSVTVARDRNPGRGPLEGIAAGLAALADQTEAAYVTRCDVPLLVPAFVTRLVQFADDADIVVPVEGDLHHPLAAVYRTTVLPHVEALLAANRLRPVFLFERVRTRRVRVDDLRDVDPDLRTLTNLNRPEDYITALNTAGFPTPPEIATALPPRGE